MTKDLPAPAENVKHPTTGAPMVLDEAQKPDRLIERHREGSLSPAAHEAYAEKVRKKIADVGYLYVDPVSGYRMRVKSAA